MSGGLNPLLAQTSAARGRGCREGRSRWLTPLVPVRVRPAAFMGSTLPLIFSSLIMIGLGPVFFEFVLFGDQ